MTDGNVEDEVKRLVVIGALVAAVALAPAAIADSSTVLNGYGSNAAKTVNQVTGPSENGQVTSPSQNSQGVVTERVAGVTEERPAATTSTLPFTGTDLGMVGAAGVVLLGLGFGLRRMGRNRS